MKNNILKTLFDIKPVDSTGRVDLHKITRIMPIVNLSKDKGDKFFFGIWDEAVGVRDLALIDGRKTIKKAPTDAASSKLVNSVGAAYSTVVRARQPSSSISERAIKSSTYVDISDSVESTGFAPVGSWLTNPNRYYTLPTVKQSYQEKLISQDELEKYLNESLNVKREIKNVGGKTVLKKKIGKPRLRPILAKLPTSQVGTTCDVLKSPDEYQTILSYINQKPAPVLEVGLVGEPKRIEPFERILATSDGRWTSDVKSSSSFAEGYGRAQPEIESWVRYVNDQFLMTNDQSIFKFQIPKLTLRKINFKYKTKSLLAYVLIGLLAFIIFTSFGNYGISVKNEVLKESSSAMAQLEQANENLRVFDFEAASNNFVEAYEEFSKAGESLNFMGASITSLFAELPGAGKLKSAKNLVEAGKLLAEAGKSMSEAVNSLSKTGAILELTTPHQSDPLGRQNGGGIGAGQASDVQDIFSSLKKSLSSSEKKLSKVNSILSDVDPDILPEEKRESFAEFQSKLPELEKLVSDAVDYTDFLERFLGFGLATSDVRGTSDVRYLVLFQNDSELRPTGGFPGTYAVVTFKDGRLADFLVDDVYNLDGQLKENIIPPTQLRHITPNWGMRDANWFIDFSASAQKMMEFFNKEAGYEVDGVITISPRMTSDILKVVGPVEMPEYGFSVDSENFLSTIQAEVEYGENREQPKSVVMDMAPKLLEKIYSSDPGQWLEIFNVFISGLDKKDILMYFKDLNLERFVADKDFGGLIKNTDSDYLMVTLTNVKGSKTDKVIDNFIKTSVRFENGRMIHKLELTRQHNGGGTRYGFYNRRNPAFVRVLVPEGSELISISGNSSPGYKPIMNYSNSGFKQDDNLFKLESGFRYDGENKASTYNESGKTGFAFWLIIDPGEKKTVELEYAVPLKYGGDSYGIYIQKQPGLEVDNFEFKVGDTSLYNGNFDKDLELRFKVE